MWRSDVPANSSQGDKAAVMAARLLRADALRRRAPAHSGWDSSESTAPLLLTATREEIKRAVCLDSFSRRKTAGQEVSTHCSAVVQAMRPAMGADVVSTPLGMRRIPARP